MGEGGGLESSPLLQFILDIGYVTPPLKKTKNCRGDSPKQVPKCKGGHEKRVRKCRGGVTGKGSKTKKSRGVL